MATNVRTLVVAVFTDHNEAQRAIDALQHAGFAGDQVNFMQLSSATTSDDQGSLSKDALVKMGISEKEADNYQQQSETGRTIVVVTTPDRYDQASGIMRENGASEVKTHQGA
jgi:hypothetical protein